MFSTHNINGKYHQEKVLKIESGDKLKENHHLRLIRKMEREVGYKDIIVVITLKAIVGCYYLFSVSTIKHHHLRISVNHDICIFLSNDITRLHHSIN